MTLPDVLPPFPNNFNSSFPNILQFRFELQFGLWIIFQCLYHEFEVESQNGLIQITKVGLFDGLMKLLFWAAMGPNMLLS